jgi:hypothetical protein
MTAEIINLTDLRARQSPLEVALASVEHHPKLRGVDKRAITALAGFATNAGFCDLDQSERSAIAGLGKFQLMGSFCRVKDADLLHKMDGYGLFKIGAKPTDDESRKAERFFRIHMGLRMLSYNLGDTDTHPYQASWLVPKIWTAYEPLTEVELIAAIQELGRLGYLTVASVTDGPNGALIRYRPAEYDDFRRLRPGDGAA